MTEYNSCVLKPCISALVLALFLTGCQPGEKTAANDAEQKSASNMQSTPPKPGPEKGSPGEFAEKTVEKLQRATKDIRPAPKGSGEWKTVKQTPAEVIAGAAEASIASAKGQMGVSTSLVNIEGSPGSSIAYFSILDATRFNIEYPRVQIEPKPNFEKEIVVSNGKRVATNSLSSRGWYDEKSLAAFKKEATTGLDAWAITFPRIIFSSLQGGKPITNLLMEARKQNLEVTLEQHPIERNKTKQTQYRILITRNKQEAATLGALEFEIVIDGQYKLPVTLKTFVQKPLRQPVKMLWTAKWSPPGQKIDPKAFDIPKIEKTSKV